LIIGYAIDAAVFLIKEMNMENKNKPVLSLTAKDFRWTYYRGSGKGGQKRNKTDNCCQCFHEPSGVMAYAEDGRSKEHNRKEAFRKVTENTKFQKWLKIETMRKMGDLKRIEDYVDNELKRNTRTEIKNEEGRWVVAKPEDIKD
jgi:protein subunit release factor B